MVETAAVTTAMTSTTKKTKKKMLMITHIVNMLLPVYCIKMYLITSSSFCFCGFYVY